MMRSTIRDKGKKLAVGALVLLFWIGIWQVIAWRVGSQVMVPAPADAIRTLAQAAAAISFWKSIAVTLLRIVGGVAAACVCGILLAALTYHFNWLSTLLSPFLVMVKSVPVASFIILLLIWLSTNLLPGVVVFIMVLPLIWSNVKKGLEQTDRELLEMAGVFHLSFLTKVKRIYIPSVIPYFTAGLTTAIGFGWKAGVTAEVLCTPKFSIGVQLYNAKVYLDTPSLFAWTMVVIIMSLVLEQLLVRLIRKGIARYQKHADSM